MAKKPHTPPTFEETLEAIVKESTGACKANAERELKRIRKS